MNSSITIPKFLEHLQTHKGMPVLFTTFWVDGVPDFRAGDPDKIRRAVMERLCGVCGRDLGEYVWFIGGPKSLEQSSLFSDPAMHRSCAEFSISVCPFLSGKTTHVNTARPIPEGMGADPLITPERSTKIGIRRCKEYMPVNVYGHGLIHVHKWWGQPIWLA